uniref:Uncharacterized protein n=1 Tax=Latimeria chalumnae TaxID=7897 RepID=H2ZSH9_LATCH
ILSLILALQILISSCCHVHSLTHLFSLFVCVYCRQSLKHQALLENQLRHSDIITGLCEDILFTFHSCLQLAEQQLQSQDNTNHTEYKLFQKTAKLCRFFANTLVRYTKEFTAFLANCCCRLHQLYLQIYSKFPPSLYSLTVSDAHRDEVACVILVTLDPLITQLLSFRSFAEVVLDEKTIDLCGELVLPQCLLLVNIMDKLPSQPEEVQNLWCAGSQYPEDRPRLPTFHALFLNFQQCYAELSVPVQLPGVMVEGQALRDVSLYQHVSVHLNAFVASLPSCHFPQLERSLLEAVLCPDMVTAMLATDTWCFLARFGTAELCVYHTTILAELVKSCPGQCHQLSHLSLLLRRLLFLMAEHHQIEFVKSFAPMEAKNLPLWQHISIKALTPELRRQVASNLIGTAVAECAKWLDNRHTLGELQQLNCALSTVLMVCSDTAEMLEEELQASTSRILCQMWGLLTVKQVLSQPYIQTTVRLLLSISASLIQATDPQLISQIILFLSSLLPLNPPDHVHLAVLDYLAALGKRFIPPEMQGQVLPKLSCLFASLLADTSWLIHQHALEAFTQFAEVTSHEEVVPQSLVSEEIQNKVVDFLNKTIPQIESEDSRRERLKQEKSVLETRCACWWMEEKEQTSDLQPCVKRARPATMKEQQYETAIQRAEEGIKSLQSLLKQSPAPSWLSARLEGLQTLLEAISRGCKAAD